ncbi:MAG: hypothetical protein ABEL76_00460, partial [Bradymonadaceae bacterium]
EPVDNLRELVAVKIACRDVRASRLDAGPEAIKVHLDEETPLNPGELVQLVRESDGDFELTSDRNLLYSLDDDEADRPLEVARWLMDRLQTVRTP